MKKLLSFLLILSMILTVAPISSLASTDDVSITAYVTVSKYGEFVENNNGEKVALLPVVLNDRNEYTLEDLFAELHNQYYDGDGYSSNVGDYGAYITKFWGDESGNFGYQINGGSETVMGLNHQVEDGDCVDVTIYKSLYPDTEAYTKFDKYQVQIYTGDELEFVLERAGYDADWNTVFSPCEGAEITVNGSDAGVITNEDGEATLYFDQTGTYIVSAYKNKTIEEETVPEITAPVCVVTVEEKYMTVTDKIAERYAGSKIVSDENMIWLVADMAIYSELYPESENILSDKTKQKCLDEIIKGVSDAETASALAKSILSLRALGYDARKVYTSSSKKIDVVGKLAELVDAQDATVTNIYSLPYVIIALSQAEGYATDDQMDYLINESISSKDRWLNDEWGTDAASAMLHALALHCEEYEDLQSIIEETAAFVTLSQDDTGIVGNAASTGICITALSAAGIDAETIECDGKDLIDGLMSVANDELNGFEPMENSFSTEQGFRGLLAWQLWKNDASRKMYDFSSYPMEKAVATKKKRNSSSSSGNVTIEKTEDNTEKEIEKKQENIVSETTPETTSQITDRNPDVKIKAVVYPDKTFNDIAENTNKEKIEALAQRGIINGKTTDTYDPNGHITRAEFAAIIARGLSLPQKEQTLFTDVKKDDWFYEYINTAYSYGIIKGISETEFNPNGDITHQEAAVMVSRAAKLCGMNIEMKSDEIKDVLASFTDYISLADWSKNDVAFCYSNGIISDEDIEILPNKKIDRATVAEMVFNMLKKSGLLQGENE